jgi:D-amino peptidase
MKIFMLWDMEGVSGLTRRKQAWYWDEDATEEDGREGIELLMADINSASEAALKAGVDELIVCDTHHGGGNIILDRMLADPRITYLPKSRGEQDGVFRWLPGLDETVDGFMVPGHHAKAGTEGAFLPHTQSLEWEDFRINGQSVGEMGIEACFAGHWGVPVAMMQGDEAACREAAEQFPGIVTAQVKRATGRETNVGPGVEEARRITAAAVTQAVEKLRAGGCRPYQPDLPMHVEAVFRTVEQADRLAARSTGRRLDDRTLAADLDRRCDVIKWLTGTGVPDQSGSPRRTKDARSEG